MCVVVVFKLQLPVPSHEIMKHLSEGEKVELHP